MGINLVEVYRDEDVSKGTVISLVIVIGKKKSKKVGYLTFPSV